MSGFMSNSFIGRGVSRRVIALLTSFQLVFSTLLIGIPVVAPATALAQPSGGSGGASQQESGNAGTVVCVNKDYVEGGGYSADTTVSVAVLDSGDNLKGSGASFTGADGSYKFTAQDLNPPSGFDIVAGDKVDFKVGEDDTKTINVADLWGFIDTVGDKVSGRIEPDSIEGSMFMAVVVDENGALKGEATATVGPDGSFSTGVGADIVAGDRGAVYYMIGSDPSTWLSVDLTTPAITANPMAKRFSAAGLPESQNVTVTVETVSETKVTNAAGELYDEATMMGDYAAEMTITIEHPLGQVMMKVAPIKAVADTDNDKVTGTTRPNADVIVRVMHPNETLLEEISTVAAADGNFTAQASVDMKPGYPASVDVTDVQGHTTLGYTFNSPVRLTDGDIDGAYYYRDGSIPSDTLAFDLHSLPPLGEAGHPLENYDHYELVFGTMDGGGFSQTGAVVNWDRLRGVWNEGVWSFSSRILGGDNNGNQSLAIRVGVVDNGGNFSYLSDLEYSLPASGGNDYVILGDKPYPEPKSGTFVNIYPPDYLRQTGSATTDFSEPGIDLRSVANLVFENPGVMKVTFKDSTNVLVEEFKDLAANVDFGTNGQIGINSEALAFLADKGATVTLYNMWFNVTPSVVAYDDLGNEIPAADLVSNVVYDDVEGTLTFDVAHFTTYKAAETTRTQLNLDDQYVYGYGYKPNQETTVTVRNPGGGEEDILTATTNSSGYFSVSSTWYMDPGDTVDVKVGDENTVTVPVVLAEIRGDAENDVISGRSVPNSQVYIEADGDNGSYEAWALTDANGYYSTTCGFDLNLDDYLMVGHQNAQGDWVTVDSNIYETIAADAFEPDALPSDGKTIATDGTPQDHTLDAAGGWDAVGFDAVEDVKYTIETYGLGENADTYLYLYDPNGTCIDDDDDSGGSLSSRIEFTADATGKYVVKVRDYNPGEYGSGHDYQLSVQGSPIEARVNLTEQTVYGKAAAVDTDVAVSIIGADGNTRGGNTGMTNAEGRYDINISPGYGGEFTIDYGTTALVKIGQDDTITIPVVNLRAAADPDNDSVYGRSVPDSEVRVTVQGDKRAVGMAATDAGGNFTFPSGIDIQPGDYFKVAHKNAEGNWVELEHTVADGIIAADAFEVDDDTGQASAIIPNGAPQERGFDLAGDQDWTKFDVVPTETYNIDTFGLGDNGKNHMDTIMGLYDAAGTELTFNNDYGDGSGNEANRSHIGWTPDDTGTLYIRVAHDDSFGYDGNVAYGKDMTYRLKVTTQSARRGPIHILSDDEFVPEEGVTGGNGTPEDPYIIEGWTIRCIEESYPIAVQIRNTTKSYIVRNMTIDMSYSYEAYGFDIFNAPRGSIEDVFVEIGWNGWGCGASVEQVDGFAIRNATFDGQDFNGTGVYLLNSTGATLENADVVGDYEFGYDITNSSNAAIGNSSLYASNGDGIRASSSDGLTVKDSTVRSLDSAIRGDSSSNLVVDGSTLKSSNSDGVSTVDYGRNLTVTDSTIESLWSGVSTSYQGGTILVDGVDIDAMNGNGVYVDDMASSLSVTDSSITCGSNGVYVSDVDGVTVDKTTIGGYGEEGECYNYGVYADYGSTLTVTGSEIESYEEGVYASYMGAVAVDNATITSHEYDGIYAEYGNSLTVTNSDVAADCCEYGVYANYMTDFVRIDNSDIYSDEDGVYVENGSNLTITNTTIDSSNDGVYANQVDTLAVDNSTVDGGNDWGYGIYDEYGNTLTVTNSTVSGNDDGIYADNVVGALTVGNSDVWSGDEDGIYANETGPVSITDSTVEGDDYGADLEYTGATTVANSTVSGWYYDGIYGDSFDSLNIVDSTIEQKDEEYGEGDAIDTDYVWQITVDNSTVKGAGDDGIIFEYGDRLTIKNGSVIEAYYDTLYNCDEFYNVEIVDSTLKAEYGDGIYFDDDSGNLTVTDSTIEAYDDAIDNSDGYKVNIAIDGSTLEGEYGDGVYSDSMYGDMSVTNSTIKANDDGIYADDALSVTVENVDVSSSDGDGIEVYYATGPVSIKNSTVECADDYGIYVYWTDNVTINDVDITNTALGWWDWPYGVYFEYVNDATIANSTIVRDGTSYGGEGVYLLDTTNVDVFNNSIRLPGADEGYGVDVYGCCFSSNEITISRNTIENAYYGIYAWAAGYAYYDIMGLSVTDNTIDANPSNNYGEGIYVYADEVDATVTGNTFNGLNAEGRYWDYGIDVEADTSLKATISDNTVSDIGWNGIYTYAEHKFMDVVAEDNTVENVANDYAVYLDSYASGKMTAAMSGNTIENAAGGVLMYSGSTAEPLDLDFTDNTVTDDTNTVGYGLLAGSSTCDIDATVLDNTISGFFGGILIVPGGMGKGGLDLGALANGFMGPTATGNISKNEITGTGYSGIELYGFESGLVRQNTIADTFIGIDLEGVFRGGTSQVVEVGEPADGNVVSDNVVTDVYIGIYDGYDAGALIEHNKTTAVDAESTGIEIDQYGFDRGTNAAGDRTKAIRMFGGATVSDNDIDGFGYGVRVYQSNDVTVTGNDIQGGDDCQVGVDAILVSDYTVESNRIDEYNIGIRTAHSNYVEVTDNELVDIGMRGIDMDDIGPRFSAVGLAEDETSSVTYNRIYNLTNEENAVGVNVYDAELVVRNNTVIGTTGIGSGLMVIEASTVNARNNIIGGFTTGIFKDTDTGSQLINTYNDVGNNEWNYANVDTGTGDISEDPLFISTDPSNPAFLRLQTVVGGFPADSPCIDTGDPADTPSPSSGSRIDIGAFDGVFLRDPKADAIAFYDYGGGETGGWLFDSRASDINSLGISVIPRLWWASDPGDFDVTRSKSVSGDFDGNGTPDVLSFYTYGGTSTGIFLFPSVGTGEPPVKLLQTESWDWSKTKLTAGDVDADGKTEVVAFYGYGGTSTGVWVFGLDAGGNLVPEMTHFSSSWDWNKTALTAGNITGTRDSVVATYNYGGTKTGFWVFNFDAGTGMSVAFNFFSDSWDATKSKMITGDVTGDGKDDLICFYNYGATLTGVWVLASTGTGLSVPVASYFTHKWDWNRSTVVPGDFTGDGQDDAAVVYDYGEGKTGFWVFKGEGGVLKPPIPVLYMTGWDNGQAAWVTP